MKARKLIFKTPRTAVQDQCKQLENKHKELDKRSENLDKTDSKLLELEDRSMRENLMFFSSDEEEGVMGMMQKIALTK